MARLKAGQGTRPFSTRIAPQTLQQLDDLVRSGRFSNRTAAIEAAVARLADETGNQRELRRQAFAASCGALTIGVTPAAQREAEIDRLEWEARRSRRG
jgi:Arc/MetJ-type ribon-helix-helix transcriptional regulator